MPEDKRTGSSPDSSDTDHQKGGGPELNRIEKMKEGLYSQRFEERDIVGNVSRQEFDVDEDWRSAGAEDATFGRRRKQERTMASKKQTPSKLRTFLIASVVFFIGAVGIAAYSILGGNVFSSEQVDISISGPVSISGGDEVMITVQITNNNDTAIEQATLSAHYPLGAYVSADSSESLTRTSHSVGRIEAHESVKQTIPVVLFGKQNSEKIIDFNLEFRFEGSNAALERTESYTTTIDSSPIDLSLEILDEVATGQEITFAVTVVSNATETLDDIMLAMNYPFNFTFDTATPEATYNNSTWRLGNLAPGEEHTIEVSGTIGGQEQDEHVFSARVGRGTQSGGNAIGVVYGSVEESVGTRAPFLDIDLVLDGDRSPEHIARSRQPIRVDVPWRNTLATQVVDGRIAVELSGEVVDEYSIQPTQGGFYQSTNDTVIWSGQETDSISVIEPNENGSVSFSFNSLPLYGKPGGGIYENPTITLRAHASGRRVSDTSVPEALQTSIEKIIKLESNIELTQRAVYTTGPFTNTGPTPPRAEQRTTYTIIWTVTNSSNEVQNATVRTALPTYINWTGNTTASTISYREVGGEVVWDLGTVDAGAGVTEPPRQVSFQVALTPSLSQIGDTPILVGEATVTGEDQFTGTTLRDTVDALTTRLSTDPNLISDGFVTQ